MSPNARPVFLAALAIVVLIAIGSLVGCGGGGSDEEEEVATDAPACGTDGYTSPEGKCFPHAR